MKKLIVIIPVILLIRLSVYIGITYFNIGKYDEYYINNTIPVMKEEYIEQITSLKEKYNNKDVVGTISIDNTDFNTVVMQGNDNSYYLNHLPDKTYNINGSIFLDYRVDIDESEKLLIFGHSSPSYFLPIMIIENYKDEDYYKEHKYIYLSSALFHVYIIARPNMLVFVQERVFAQKSDGDKKSAKIHAKYK